MAVVEACITTEPDDRPKAPELLHYIEAAFSTEAVDAEMAAFFGLFTLQERDPTPKSDAIQSDSFSDTGSSALVTVRLESLLCNDSRISNTPFNDREPRPAKFRALPFRFKRYVMMDICGGLEIQKFIVHYLDQLRTLRITPNGLPCGLLFESPDADIEQYRSRSGSDVEFGTRTTFNRGRHYDTLMVWPNESVCTADKLTTREQLEDVFSIKAAQLIIIGPFRTDNKLRNSADLSSRRNWEPLIEDAQNGERLLRVSRTALTSEVFP